MNRTAMAPQPITQAPNVEQLGRMVPFDYTFQIKLEGHPQKTHRAKLTVSIEAGFTAVSIGYGVVPELTPIVFGPDSALPGSKKFNSSGQILRDISLGDLMLTLEKSLSNTPNIPKNVPMLEAALLSGIRLNSRFSGQGLLLDNSAAVRGPSPVDNASLQKMFQVVAAPDRDVQFLYALFDDGSGREFQSAPLLNTAALGASDGKRPFRYFAKPISFAPLSTIRVEITELGDFRGELHISLQGYKVLGGAGTPTGSNSASSRRRTR